MAEDELNGGKHLVEVEFALDDEAATQPDHTVLTLWISEKHRGCTRHVAGSWAGAGVRDDADALEKAGECLRLLKPLQQPKDLPKSSNRIVTVRYAEGSSIMAKQFPIDQAPYAIHQILTIIGLGEPGISWPSDRLKFIPRPPNGGQPK